MANILKCEDRECVMNEDGQCTAEEISIDEDGTCEQQSY